MAYTRIHSKGPYQYAEATLGEAVTPGHLCELNTSGNLIKHAEQGGRAEALFAVEDALQGKTVSDAYTSGTIAGYIIPGKGSEVNALIQSGQAGSINDELVSAGDGTLQRRGSSGSGVTEWQTVAVLLESFTTLSANALKRVRIV